LKKETAWFFLALSLTIAGAAATSLYSYLLFHVFAELFSIAIAGGIFILAWNTRRFQKSDFLVFIGIAFLFTGFIDLIHTLTYQGMAIFPDDPNLPTQLWIAARSLEMAALLAAPLMLWRKGHEWAIFAVFAGVTAAILLAIATGIFPAGYIAGAGLTPFKIAVECVICFGLVLAGVHFWLNRDGLDRTVLSFLLAAIAFTVLSELSFTLYADVFDGLNMLGHLLKVVAFALIYAAIIETGLQRPYDLIFRDLTLAEARARKERDTAQNYLDIAGVIILALDLEGRVTLINRKGESLLGLPQHEILGKDWFGAFVPKADLKELLSGYHDALSGKIGFETHENSVITADGTLREIRWANAILKDGQGTPIGLLSSGSDVTEENLSKEALRQANQKLALLGSITRHDTLNHLTALSGYLELAKIKYDDQQRTFLDRAETMARAIETDLLFGAEYQKMGSSPPAWQEPAPLIRACAADMEDGAIVQVDLTPVLVYADPMLRKVFCNLIANAIDHGGRVSRIVFTAEERDGGLVIVCKDDGVGIPPEEKEIIFSSGYGKNHGYGLFLIREILAITGILIRETGEAGRGARFEIFVPDGKFKTA